MLYASDEKLKGAIEAGDVKLVEKSIDVQVQQEGADGKKTTVTKTFPYTGVEAVTPKGAAAIMDGAVNTKDDDGNIIRQSVVGAFNYAIDLFQRANERSKALGTLEDPKKADDKAVAALVKAGWDEAEARQMVADGRKRRQAAAAQA